MTKSKFSVEQRVQACLDYISGQKSAAKIANELKLSKNGEYTVMTWARVFKVQGEKAFVRGKGNEAYTSDFKRMVVNEYLSARISLLDLTAKYNIPGKSTILCWIKKYNNHIELTDYDPKPEVYMADTLKTTYEERLEIVKYCLTHDRDIKGTASKYGCKYAQLYQWVRKFETHGEESLLDKRGKRKQEVDLSELEKAERKISQLEREKEEYRKKYELLKKAEKLERW
jgi:transposase-like protein